MVNSFDIWSRTMNIPLDTSHSMHFHIVAINRIFLVLLWIQLLNRFDCFIEFDVLIWFRNIYAFEDFPLVINLECSHCHRRRLRYTFSFQFQCVIASFECDCLFLFHGNCLSLDRSSHSKSKFIFPLCKFRYVYSHSVHAAVTDNRSLHRFCCCFASFAGFELCKRSMQSSGCVYRIHVKRRCDRFIRPELKKKRNQTNFNDRTSNM